MSNMSYCRFQNTVRDMEDCIDNFEDFICGESSDIEVRAYSNFIRMIIGFNNNYDLESILKDKDLINEKKY